MPHTTFTVIVGLIVAAHGLAGCSGSPVAPSPLAVAGSSSESAAPPPIGGQMISGSVYDTALRRLGGATVELLDGPQAGISTTTDANGSFTLFGIVDDTTRFRASKGGHATATATILPDCPRCNPRRWVHFYLEVLEPPVALAGDYALTFIAAPSCTNLPGELRTRTYAVSVEASDLTWPGFPAQSSSSFKVTARGGEFPPGLNYFYLNVASNFVNISLGDHTDPGIAERVAPNAYFAFNGWAAVSTEIPVSTISTPFEGWIDYCVNPAMGERYDCTPDKTVTRARCESANHQLILRRQ